MYGMDDGDFFSFLGMLSKDFSDFKVTKVNSEVINVEINGVSQHYKLNIQDCSYDTLIIESINRVSPTIKEVTVYE